MQVLLRALEAIRVRWLMGAPRYPVTFVVGPPRCGTTVVGLHLLRARRFATIPNVAKAHPRWPTLATNRALAAGGRDFDYANHYGKAAGDLAPSDGWDLVERFFESYREARADAAPAARGLIKLVAAFEALYQAPFLLKNNANSMRIGALEQLFPGCFWIHVRRAYPEAAASLLEARARHGVALGKWWSAAPPQFLGRSFADPLEQVAFTLVGLDRYLETELAPAHAQGRAKLVEYEEFCARPTDLVAWLDARYAATGMRLKPSGWALPERFDASKLPDAVRGPMERTLAPWLDQARLELGLMGTTRSVPCG